MSKRIIEARYTKYTFKSIQYILFNQIYIQVYAVSNAELLLLTLFIFRYFFYQNTNKKDCLKQTVYFILLH